MANRNDILKFKEEIEYLKDEFKVSTFEAYMMIIEIERNEILRTIKSTLHEDITKTLKGIETTLENKSFNIND